MVPVDLRKIHMSNSSSSTSKIKEVQKLNKILTSSKLPLNSQKTPLCENSFLLDFSTKVVISKNL